MQIVVNFDSSSTHVRGPLRELILMCLLMSILAFPCLAQPTFDCFQVFPPFRVRAVVLRREVERIPRI